VRGRAGDASACPGGPASINCGNNTASQYGASISQQKQKKKKKSSGEDSEDSSALTSSSPASSNTNEALSTLLNLL